MKKIILILSLLIAGKQVLANEINYTAKVTNSAKIDTQFGMIAAKYSQLNIAAPSLEFAPIWQTWQKQRHTLDSGKLDELAQDLVKLKNNLDSLSFCQRVALSEIDFQVQLQQERALLLQQLPAHMKEYQGSFSHLPNGKAWYLHWLKSWLLAEATIEELEKIAKQELLDAQQRRVSLVDSQLSENHDTYSPKEKQKIIAAFKQRERAVYRQLNSLIAGEYHASNVNIEESNLPKSFPAPGIYNPENQAFIYHLQSEKFPKAHMDWLFLHEVVPGHHYQSQWAMHNANCADYNGSPASTTFSEGWAAYVELFGSELGLYRDKSSAEYALDWQALRAVRVLLDIGLHFYGWSDEQAQRVWLEHIPQQQAIMHREINRIRSWPVQVITYVYGKAMIQQAVSQLVATRSDMTLADIHARILSLSNLSLTSLRHLNDFNMSKKLLN